MTDLAAWLTQIWDEREKKARIALEYERGDHDGPFLRHAADYLGGELADHIAANDPASVLARIAADRQILDAYQKTLTERPPNDPHQEGMVRGWVDGLDLAVRLLAQPYADWPGYREEWKP